MHDLFHEVIMHYKCWDNDTCTKYNLMKPVRSGDADRSERIDALIAKGAVMRVGKNRSFTNVLSLQELEGVVGGFFSSSQMMRAFGQALTRSNLAGGPDWRGPYERGKALETAAARPQFEALKSSNPALFPPPLTVSAAGATQGILDANQLAAQRLGAAILASQPQLLPGR